MNDATLIEVFFDGDCPLCMREIRFLARRDSGNRICFTDISVPTFAPLSYGLEQEDFMDRIRGRLPDGSMIDGVEVFRRLYAAVGFKWTVRLTRLPGIAHILELGYKWFAKNRLKLTGRCDAGSCEVPERSARA